MRAYCIELGGLVSPAMPVPASVWVDLEAVDAISDLMQLEYVVHFDIYLRFHANPLNVVVGHWWDQYKSEEHLLKCRAVHNQLLVAWKNK